MIENMTNLVYRGEVASSHVDRVRRWRPRSNQASPLRGASLPSRNHRHPDGYPSTKVSGLASCRHNTPPPLAKVSRLREAAKNMQLIDASAAGILLADRARRLTLMAASDKQVGPLEFFQIPVDEGATVSARRSGLMTASSLLRRECS